MAPDEGELTVAQLAQYLQVSAEQIFRWWLTGEGPPPRPGDGVPRWRRCDVDAWRAEGGLRRVG